MKLQGQYTVAELKSTHVLYTKNKSKWTMYNDAFEGIEAVIKGGYIKKHEREPQESYERRMKELYGFGYSSSVIRILNHFLFKKPPTREIKDLEKEKQWQMFWNDCNLNGDDWDTVFMNTIMLYSSILGHIGILVDKSPINYKSVQEEITNNVYPYMAVYFPLAILDWKFDKDENNRPFLSYLKLMDEDGSFRLWTDEEWAIFVVPEDIKSEQEKITKFAGGRNALGFIPFTWHYNLRSKNPAIGISDLTEIARLDISIIKNCSQLEEVIDYAAFPMMTKPRRDAKPGDISSQDQFDEVSVKAIQEFDPEYPESKPAWLKPEIAEAIKGILDTISIKKEELYRTANTGGVTGTEIQTQAKSGIALQTEFQMLNAELVAKATNLEKTENKVAEFWLKWQNLWDKYKESFHFGRPKNFDIENLAADLENALTAKTIVMSKTFNALLQKQTAKQTLPGMSEEDIAVIDEEIDAAVEIENKEPKLMEEDEKDTTIIEQVNG